jgi:hypothetical protein
VTQQKYNELYRKTILSSEPPRTWARTKLYWSFLRLVYANRVLKYDYIAPDKVSRGEEMK